jgi:hypothetical protein
VCEVIGRLLQCGYNAPGNSTLTPRVERLFARSGPNTLRCDAIEMPARAARSRILLLTPTTRDEKMRCLEGQPEIETHWSSLRS